MQPDICRGVGHHAAIAERCHGDEIHSSSDFARQIDGYGLTTADILYRLLDHPSILQEFIWQDYDRVPRFPELNKFLMFWQAKLDGKLFRITVSHKDLIGPADLQSVSGEFRLQ